MENSLEEKRIKCKPRLDAATVREAARGRWASTILPALNISVPEHARKHGPCPTCGGKDRFRFDDREGLGTWFCNQCDSRSGDGFRLIQNVQRCSFPESLAIVAGILGLEPLRAIDRTAIERTRRQRQAERTSQRRRQEADGLTIDALRAASDFIEARRGLDISQWSDRHLDDELHALSAAYSLIESEALA